MGDTLYASGGLVISKAKQVNSVKELEAELGALQKQSSKLHLIKWVLGVIIVIAVVFFNRHFKEYKAFVKWGVAILGLTTIAMKAYKSPAFKEIPSREVLEEAVSDEQIASKDPARQQELTIKTTRAMLDGAVESGLLTEADIARKQRILRSTSSTINNKLNSDVIEAIKEYS